ncbi:uncharacterized protein LY89DRAFT_200413 [Mollisia scopiformis]|uniref:Uncharacterized protein n=1 Tax=Mollisia scopiformis TaxID=149040 RepID=A0A194WYP5_MOLSC|nr:uncharacterized protein LY89DRAFT_200413 [Mollisia scopiformis]KUJ13070.1 hypothetical protein LY89DRAFT_200413 [Mollisia scopiformis]
MDTARPSISTEAPEPDSPSQTSKPKADTPAMLEDLGILTPEEIADVRRLMKRDSLASDRHSYWLQAQFWWSPSWSTWGSDGSRMIQAEFIKSGSPCITKGIGNEVMMCNKATAFYWMESAQTIPRDGNGLAILGSIFKYWTEALGRQPYVQLHDFFAAPISVKAKSATTIPEILYGHRCIYAQAQELLRSPRMGKEIDSRYFRLHPLFEALITVFDEYIYVEEAMESFETLKHEALPLARDEDLNSIDIIRVPLRTGVRFVANLLLHEDAAHPESTLSNTAEAPDSPFAEWDAKWEKNSRREEASKIGWASKSEDPDCEPVFEFSFNWV